MDGFEIERKFKVNPAEVPGLKTAKHKEIQQGYCGSNEEPLRIRKIGGKYFLTKKTGSGMVRTETEEEISEKLYNIMYVHCMGRIVNKTRYYIKLKGPGKLVAEVDIYKAPLNGFAVVEVEFESVEQANKFVPPQWFGEEITNDDTLTNASISKIGTDERM